MNYFTLSNLAKFAVFVAIIKFAGEGGIGWNGHVLNMGHVDSSTYVMFLGPILGHNAWKEKGVNKDEPKV